MIISEKQTRQALVDAVRRLEALGLNRGSTGNASHRMGPGMLITPTGAGAELTPEDLTYVRDDGAAVGRWAPSSEWQFHRAIYRARPDAMAVLHTHAPHATALGCLGLALPAFHYMVAVAGGDDVPLVPYATFGSEPLAQGVAQALAERDACLMAQHGLTTCGKTLPGALRVMEEVESLCQIYLLARAVGEPPRLDGAEMKRVKAQFRSYGRRRLAAPKNTA
jgi:L-fuculose-phosphate aldolase